VKQQISNKSNKLD